MTAQAVALSIGGNGWLVLGNNLKKQNMIREDGACYDGLYEYGPNPNAGAESNICFLIASLEMKNRGLLAT